MNKSIGRIKEVVEARYGCKAHHIGSEAVTVRAGDEANGQVLWDGVVETFELQDWKRCYAWNHQGEDGKGCVTVLEQASVIGPHSAVLVALAARQKPD
jgi:hypothetical protein